MKCQQTITAVLTFLIVKIGVQMQSYLSRMPEISIHKKSLLFKTVIGDIARRKVAQWI